MLVQDGAYFVLLEFDPEKRGIVSERKEEGVQVLARSRVDVKCVCVGGGGVGCTVVDSL